MSALSLDLSVYQVIYSHLSPEETIVCERVCKQWLAFARDSQVYQTLASHYNYFYRREGVLLFTGEEAREKFIALYKLVREYKLESIQKCLPEEEAFPKDMNTPPSPPIPNFEYEAHRSALSAYQYLGGMESDERPFILACIYGDKELIQMALESTTQLSQDLLLGGITHASTGNHHEVVSTLKPIVNLDEQVAIFDITWGDFLLETAQTPEMRLALSKAQSSS